MVFHDILFLHEVNSSHQRRHEHCCVAAEVSEASEIGNVQAKRKGRERGGKETATSSGSAALLSWILLSFLMMGITKQRKSFCSVQSGPGTCRSCEHMLRFGITE